MDRPQKSTTNWHRQQSLIIGKVTKLQINYPTPHSESLHACISSQLNDIKLI
jgi:hypothetical protein